MAIGRLKNGQPLIFGGDTKGGGGHICIAYGYNEETDEITLHLGWKGRAYAKAVSTDYFENFNDFAYLNIYSNLNSVPNNPRFKVGSQSYSTHNLESFVHKEAAVAYEDLEFHALQCSCGKLEYEKHPFVNITSGTKKCTKCGKIVSTPTWSN